LSYINAEGHKFKDETNAACILYIIETVCLKK
jgi:hypothetical protein